MLGIVFRSDDVKVEKHIFPSPGAYGPVGEKDSSLDKMLCATCSAKAGPGGGGCTEEVSETRWGGRQRAFLRML